MLERNWWIKLERYRGNGLCRDWKLQHVYFMNGVGIPVIVLVVKQGGCWVGFVGAFGQTAGCWSVFLALACFYFLLFLLIVVLVTAVVQLLFWWFIVHFSMLFSCSVGMWFLFYCWCCFGVDNSLGGGVVRCCHNRCF